MKIDESLSKLMIKRIVSIALILVLLLGFGVFAGTQRVNSVTIKFSDKTELTVITTQTNVNEILKENNIYILDGETVTPSFEENIGEDKVITISRVKNNTNTEDVEEQAGEILGVQTIESSAILEANNGTIVETIEKQTVEIPFETITKEVTSNEAGEKVNKVIQEGKNGIKEITYKVKYKNDIEIERTQLSEVVIQEPVNKIVQVSVKVAVSSRGSSAVRTGAGTWTYSAGDIDLLCAITAQESSRNYEGSLAVITCACNRAERRGSDPLSEYKRPGQFCYSASVGGNWQRFLNGKYPGFVRQAVEDALNGSRNHSYTSFRSANGATGPNVIGGNRYF